MCCQYFYGLLQLLFHCWGTSKCLTIMLKFILLWLYDFYLGVLDLGFWNDSCQHSDISRHRGQLPFVHIFALRESLQWEWVLIQNNCTFSELSSSCLWLYEWLVPNFLRISNSNPTSVGFERDHLPDPWYQIILYAHNEVILCSFFVSFPESVIWFLSLLYN